MEAIIAKLGINSFASIKGFDKEILKQIKTI
jgi:hypothetical protein